MDGTQGGEEKDPWAECETISGDEMEDVFEEMAEEWLEEKAEAKFKKYTFEWLAQQNKSEYIAKNYAESKRANNTKSIAGGRSLKRQNSDYNMNTK